MKYIKLYEAFKATILSKMNSYLKKSGVPSSSKGKFLEDLNKLFGVWGIPIDKIEDSDIIYKSRRELFTMDCPEFNNEFGIYGIKFWFSKDGEYLGRTAIGNSEKIDMKSDKIELLPEELLTNLKDGFLGDRYTNGTLIPINRDLDTYHNLPTGTEVISFLSEEDYEEVKWNGPLTHGVIYSSTFGYLNSSSGNVFIIHNNSECDGSYPGGDSDVSQYGDYGWGICDNEKVLEDHYYLCVYESGDNPLEYNFNNDELDTLNLDLNINGKILPFKTSNFNKVKKDADFGIFINLDSILKRGGYKNTKETKLKRLDSKIGVIGGKLGLSNDELKEINLKRYSDILIKKYGISTEGIDFDKLNILIGNLLSEWFIMELLSNVSIKEKFLNNLLYHIDKLFLSIQAGNDYTIKYSFNSIKYSIENIKKIKINYDQKISVISSHDENLGKLFLLIKEIGKQYLDKIKSTKFEDLYDLEELKLKNTFIRKYLMIQFHETRLPMNQDKVNLRNYIYRFMTNDDITISYEVDFDTKNFYEKSADILYKFEFELSQLPQKKETFKGLFFFILIDFLISNL